MYLRELQIEGYKGFREPFSILFHRGLNVIVGENASGKTAIIDAIRLLLREDEFGYTPIAESDFHRPFGSSHKTAQSFRIRADFTELSREEHVAFLPWSDMEGNASLTLHVDNKPNHRGRYKRTIWGGASRESMFEWELFDTINLVYLPPLRDAEARLSEGKSSRLARLLKNLERPAIQVAKTTGELLPLEKKVREFNEDLSSDENGVIARANKLIKGRLKESLGDVLSQDTSIQFSEVSFSRIVESLRLLFFPYINEKTTTEDFRILSENSLGYNNLLYIATVLAELTESGHESDYLRVLLIEEPEAHLHPQLQIRLLKYLETAASANNVQVIVTTHSPVLASSVSLDTIIQISYSKKTPPRAIGISSCGLTEDSKAFLNRWLDVTKSTLLFARGIILVEGISEAMLIPEFARIVLSKHDALPENLEDAGVSVINMNGIYFTHFMQLFCDLGGAEGQNLPIRCAGITDRDPPKKSKPTPSRKEQGNNSALEFITEIKGSTWARLYANDLKTFEYDLAFEGNNIKVMAEVLAEKWPTDGPVKKSLTELAGEDWDNADEENKAEAASELLLRIDDRNNMGKGQFAQLLAEEVKEHANLTVPEYIRKAVIWACGGDPDE